MGSSKATSTQLGISADWGEGVQETFAQEYAPKESVQDYADDNAEYYDFEEDWEEDEAITLESLWVYYRWPLLLGLILGVAGYVFHMTQGVEKTMYEASKVAAAGAMIGFGLSVGFKSVVEELSGIFEEYKIMWATIAIAIGVATADYFNLMPFTLPMLDIAGQENNLRIIVYLAIGWFGGALLQEFISPGVSDDESSTDS